MHNNALKLSAIKFLNSSLEIGTCLKFDKTDKLAHLL